MDISTGSTEPFTLPNKHWGGKCMVMWRVYLSAHGLQILRSPSRSQLEVFPLVFGSLSLRHFTGLAPKVPSTTRYLKICAFWDSRQKANRQIENDPASSQNSTTVWKVASWMGPYPSWGCGPNLGIGPIGIVRHNEEGENHYFFFENHYLKENS